MEPGLDHSRLGLNEKFGIDLELLESCLFSGTIFARSIQCPLIQVREHDKADWCDGVSEAIAQPMCKVNVPNQSGSSSGS